MEAKTNKKHYVLGYDWVELSTYGAYDERTDEQEERLFCVPRKWAEDWLSAYDGRKIKKFLEEYTWDDAEQMYESAERMGQLLPINIDDPIYNIKQENKEHAREINELSDTDFYDLMMNLAQMLGIAYIDVNGFCDKLRSILYEIQNSILEDYNGSVEEFIAHEVTKR